MAETVTNRGKWLLATSDASIADLRMCYFTYGASPGTVHDPDLDTVADLEAVADVSVAAERVALANVVATEDDTNDRAELDADTVSFSAASGVDAEGVAVYVHDAGGDASSNLIGIYTTNFPKAVDGGLNVNLPSGFLRLTSP